MDFFAESDAYTQEAGITLWCVTLDKEEYSEEQNLTLVHDNFGDFSSTPSLYYIGEGETQEDAEVRAFAAYVRGEVRADANLTAGENGAVVPKTIADRIMEFVDGKLIDKMCTYDAYIAGAREEMLARLNG